MREDLTAFFADWAECVTLPNGRTIKAISDATFVGVGEVAGVESSAISILARTCDVKDLEFGSVLEWDDASYTVRGVEPDGTGMTTLRLETV